MDAWGRGLDLAEDLPEHPMPASIDNLLRPADVGRELPGSGVAVVPPGGVQSAAHRRWCRACWIKKAKYAKFNKILALSSASKF